MDWAGWAVFGLVATTGLTAVMIAAQLAGRTRLDLPLMLGTITTEDPDRARVAGFAIHLAIGQVFALFYAAGFAALDRSDWWLGALFGLAHAAIALTVLVPLLQGVHPRMASERAGPASTAVLEPPGLFALNYGTATPLVAVGAHVVYGAVLGLFLGSCDDVIDTELAGFIGAGLAGAAYVPQISHLIRAHCSAGISRVAFGVWLAASLLVTTHAVAIGATVFIALGAIQLAATALILVYATKYANSYCAIHLPPSIAGRHD